MGRLQGGSTKLQEKMQQLQSRFRTVFRMPSGQIYFRCQYFVTSGEQPSRSYIGAAFVRDSADALVRFDRDMHFCRADATPGIDDADALQIAQFTVRRIFGSVLRIRLAEPSGGSSLFRQSFQYKGPAFYMYRLDEDGRVVGSPHKLRLRARYMLVGESCLLTNDDRCLTLYFRADENGIWNLPVR